jgi:hypothetical protein
MNGLQSLVEAWSLRRKHDDPYESVELFAEGDAGDLWPYAVLHEQIEAGWADEQYRGALALNLARSYKPADHAVAAFVTLGGKWPTSNPTTALNLLVLAHRVTLTPANWVDRFLGRVSLECLRYGLRDPRPLVSEGAANIMGGLGRHHFATATSNDLTPLRDLVTGVLDRIDQPDLAAFMKERVQKVLADATSAVGPDGICEADARRMLRELEPHWARLASRPRDTEPLATLRTHVAALVWRYTGSEPRSVQVVYVYPANGSTPFRGWAVVDPWVDTVKSLLNESRDDGQPKVPKRKVDFETVDAMSGSLLVALRVDADEETQEAITKSLQEAKATPIVQLDQFADLGDLLRRQKIRVRVAHVEADGGSASIAVVPDAEEPTTGPYRSRRLTTKEIPQANDLDKIFAVVDCAGNGEVVTMAAIAVTTERQVQYYKAAARLLSLISTPSGDLTRAGWLVYVANGDDKYRRLCAAFEASPCGQAWIEWAQKSKLNEIPPNSAQPFLAERSELTGDTIGRRASTLNVWLDILRRY